MYCTICGEFGHQEQYHYGGGDDYRWLPVYPAVDVRELQRRIKALEAAVFGKAEGGAVGCQEECE